MIQPTQQLEKFKNIELAQVRVEERKNYQNHISKIKADYDQKIIQMQQDMMFLEERESKRWSTREQVLTSFDLLVKELEIANMEMRQKILDEGNRLALKEATLRNEVELKSKEILMERDLLARRYKDAESKIEELSQFKEKYSRQMQENMAQYKIDLNREHAALLSSVEVEKTRLEGERAMLNERAAVTDQMMNNVKHAQMDIDSVRNGLREAQAQLAEAIKEKDSAQLHVRELQLKV